MDEQPAPYSPFRGWAVIPDDHAAAARNDQILARSARGHRSR
jgi:hypothetical protein